MTHWPWCLAEIALYSVLAGLAIGFALDVRARWKVRRRDDENDDDDDNDDDNARAEASSVSATSAQPPRSHRQMAFRRFRTS